MATGLGNSYGKRTEGSPNRQVGQEVMLPRLSVAMQRQGILSQGEAQSAIRGLKSGDTGGGGEAVWHYGGASKLAADAFRNRNAYRNVGRYGAEGLRSSAASNIY